MMSPWIVPLIALPLLTAALCFAQQAEPQPAGLVLPSIVGDHMVLQRDAEAALWGWDAPGQAVTVRFRGAEATASAGEDGAWALRVPTGQAGGPFELTVEGSETRTLTDVMVGEVWVAGGQSNMWWRVNSSRDAEQEKAAADIPAIRVWDANTHPRAGGWRQRQAQRDVPNARWTVSAPDTAGMFPAPAYFFAREIHEELGVPVGIVNLSVPGQRIETFFSEKLAAVHFPFLIWQWEHYERDYPAMIAKYETETLPAWQQAKADAEAAGEKVPPEPRRPEHPDQAPRPGAYFNGMVLPAAPFSARGFLWWQGESNAGQAMQYRLFFPAMIQEWRQLWGGSDMPFLFVELANFLQPQQWPVEDSPWPALRDAQQAALELPEAFLISVIDIMPIEAAHDIHPPDKQLAGHRLALTALANVYGREGLIWSGPRLRSAEFEGSRAVVSFDHVGSGLVARGGELRGFALAGADRKWHWAEARIDGDRVVLTSPDVPAPVAVRYNWANNPIGTLFNEEGLPTGPFRTDDWILTFGQWNHNRLPMGP